MLDEPLGHERHALGDRLPVVVGVARHEVEGHAHGLHRAAEDAQVAQALAGVVLGRARARAVRASPRRRCGRRRSAIVGGVERAQRGAVELGALVDAVGGVVGHLVVVAGDARAGRRERIEGGEALDVVVGERRTRASSWTPPSLRRSVAFAARRGRHVRAARLAPKLPHAGSGVETSTPDTTGSTTFDGCASERDHRRPSRGARAARRTPTTGGCRPAAARRSGSAIRRGTRARTGRAARARAMASSLRAAARRRPACSVWTGRSSVDRPASSARWLARSQPLCT